MRQWVPCDPKRPRRRSTRGEGPARRGGNKVDWCGTVCRTFENAVLAGETPSESLQEEVAKILRGEGVVDPKGRLCLPSEQTRLRALRLLRPEGG